MACSCQSGNRRLLLFAPNLTERYAELWHFSPGGSWEPIPEREAICVDIGPDHPWQTLRELANFLHAILDADRLAQLTAAWLKSCGSIPAQQPAKLDAEPLMEMAPLDSGPLADVLQNGRIETWYQPVVTPALELWGYECLMRGRSAAGEALSPKRLLDWAHQEQLLFMLDRVSRESHLRNAGRADIAEDARLLINFLPTAVYDPAYCLRTTVKAASEVGLSPERIVFEVVESEQVTDREHLKSILGFYRNAGFNVALDDVGAGYSGLMMLAELNPDLIKIDREIVRQTPHSRMHRSVCRSLVDLARESGKQTLAEGIETENEKAAMDAMGVDLLQGFLFGKPTPEPMQPNERAQALH